GPSARHDTVQPGNPAGLWLRRLSRDRARVNDGVVTNTPPMPIPALIATAFELVRSTGPEGGIGQGFGVGIGLGERIFLVKHRRIRDVSRNQNIPERLLRNGYLMSRLSKSFTRTARCNDGCPWLQTRRAMASSTAAAASPHRSYPCRHACMGPCRAGPLTERD